MTRLLCRAVLLSILAGLTGTTGGSLQAQVNPVADAQKKLVRIEIALEAAQTQFEMALNNYRNEQWQDKMEDLRQATDPRYQRRISAGRLSFKLSQISYQYGALARISQLVTLKLRVAQVLPLEDQLRMVNEELNKAQDRRARAPSASTSAQIMTLMNARTRIRLQIQRGNR